MPLLRHAHLGCVGSCAIWLLACSSPAPDEAPAAGEPAGWSDPIALTPIQDLSADPNVLEVNLEARLEDVQVRPGAKTKLWTYNGGVPGPLLRAKVGDRLIVHFKNSLPEPTSIHWHGLRIPNDMDGVPDAPYPAVAPGESFDYDFVLPDAGTYWYHPHYASAQQVGDGLYGPLVVDDPNEPAGLGDEAVLVLSDMGLDDQNQLEPADGGGEFGTLFGREGNVILVNGKELPELTVRRGVRQRWRVINAAKARYFDVKLGDNHFTRIGGEGGLLEKPEQLDQLLLTPAQRADVILEPTPAPGSNELTLRWLPYDRGFGTAFNRPEEDVMKLRFTDEQAAPNPELPTLSRDIPVLDPTGARPIDISLTIGKDPDGHLEMGINGVPSMKAEHIMTPLGQRQLWTVKNTFEFDHPFHLHGYFFQVLDLNGVPPAQREWRDTVNVPVDGTLRFVVDFNDRPGMWMFHCHILDHADAGMMGMVHVE
ncbi:MAG TPA: multicopper oxidase family protein [Polyangiaceae bacterium]|nr:multicopper oxidase family protein [Polyangiaceae bacterium]